MDYLLDTQALIWFLEGDERHSAMAKGIIHDDTADCHIKVQAKQALCLSQLLS